MAVPGEAKLMAQLKRLEKLNMSNATKAMAEVVYKESQSLVPVDEGDLKESGQVVQKGEEATVEYGTDHALHVEFGTVKMQAQPYLRPAFETTKRQMVKDAAKEVQQEIKEAL